MYAAATGIVVDDSGREMEGAVPFRPWLSQSETCPGVLIDIVSHGSMVSVTLAVLMAELGRPFVHGLS